MQINIALLASGSGSNAQRICEYFQGHSSIKPAVIISNNPNAFVLERARQLGVQSELVSKKELNDPAFFKAILAKHNIDFIVLAGFLLLIPEYLVNAFPNKIVNVHPALLPKYGGKGMYGHHVHEAVVANQEKQSGITIHYVNERFDEGEFIVQAYCNIETTDSAADVAQKIHQLEHAYFPVALEQVILKTHF